MRLTGLDGFAELAAVTQLGETVVMRARAPDGTRVLLKTHASDLPGSDTRERLRREHAVTSAVEHPHLVRARELIDRPNRTALVLDDHGDNSLADGAADLIEILDVAVAVADALAALHVAGIVHRSVDASHIHLSDNGPLLTDLYDATAAGSTPRRSPHGRHHAPEQLGYGRVPATTASDQFGLATTVDHLVIGHGFVRSAALAAVVERATDPDPDARYPSMLGLRDDLARIRDAERDGRTLPDPFDLSTDVARLAWSDPDSLIGRDREISELREHIEATARTGVGRVVVIRADPGAGRTSLVSALCDQLADDAVLSGLGQFEKGGPTPPLRAPLDMVDQVVSLLLAMPDERVDAVRRDLLDRLGPDLPLATRLLPALAALVPEQPESGFADPGEALEQIERAVRGAIAALASNEPPLVSVFDDADHADRSSLRTLEMLAGHPDAGPLVVVLTAAPQAPRLDQALARLGRRGIAIHEVSLSPLTAGAIAEVLAQGTGDRSAGLIPLAEAIWARSGGSASLVLADVWDLLRTGQLRVDLETGTWTHEASALTVGEPDDLDSVSTRRLDDLDEDARRLTTAVALTGRSATVPMLAAWSGEDEDQVIAELDRAVAARVLVPRSDDRHRFVCVDRSTRRAALELVDPDDLVEQRRTIADAILATSPTDRDRRPTLDPDLRFTLIELLRGHPDLDEPGPRRDLFVELCIESARQGHREGAFQEALDLQMAAIGLLGPDAWTRQPGKAFELHLRAAEHALIIGRASLVDDLLDRMDLDRRAPDQRVRALRLLGTRAWTRGDGEVGLASLRGILDELGEPLPERIGWRELATELAATRRALVGRTPESFLDLAPLDDDRVAAALDAMLACVHLAYVDQPLTHVWLVLRGTRLTARHGLTEASAYFLCGYGMLNLSIGPAIGTGLRFAAVGRELSRTASAGVTTMVAFAHEGLIRHWGAPLGDTVDPLWDEFHRAVAANEHGYGLTGGTFAALHALLASQPLPRLDQQTAAAVADLERLGEQRFSLRIEIVRDVIAELRGDPERERSDPTSRIRGGELALIVHTLDGMIALCLGDTRRLEAATRAGRHLLRTAPGSAVLAHHAFHEAYLAARDLPRASSRSDRTRRRLRAERALRRLRTLARHAPANHAHRVAFVEALLAERTRGARAAERAMDRFERAVSLATASGALADLGVIAEAAARFHARRNRVAIARHYTSVAAGAWDAWGADAVAAGMTHRLPAQLTIPTHRPVPTNVPTGTSLGLDVTSETLAEASSLLGEELEVHEFLERLVELLLRHTGANRGWLVLQSPAGPLVEVAAVMEADNVEVIPSLPTGLDAHPELCRPAVNFVLRTRQVMSVIDPANDRRLRSDTGLRQRSPRSLLGLPVGRTGTTTGVLVLESDTYTHAFEAERIEAVQVLSAQAISAIDQARLSSDLSILSGDLAELRETASVLTDRAETDPLTGMANRAGMETRLHAAIRAAQSTGRPPGDQQVGVLFCDLDDFKAINDHFGHAAGDRVLVEIARRLRAATRADDIVVRIGGDEFVVVSVGVTVDELERMADRALSEIAQSIEIEPDTTVSASVSIGIGRADLGSVTSIDDIDALVQVADRAMYDAKHSGKNQISKAAGAGPGGGS